MIAPPCRPSPCRIVPLVVAVLVAAAGWRTVHAAPPPGPGDIQSAVDKARDYLLSGPPSLHAEPTYHYNLACYECALGHLDLARLHLDKSFSMDKKMRDLAKRDPDLAALRE